jgi:class 3 adenylate cyclase
MHKNLGDGMMMVWEIPAALDLSVQGRIAQQIVSIINNMALSFYHHFRNLTGVELDSYSEEVTTLNIGFGVTKGHAWRLDFGHSVDYAGSIINLASRLESLARPGGIIALYDVSNWFFDANVETAGNGHIVKIKTIRGYGSDVTVWISPDVDPSQKGFSVIK